MSNTERFDFSLQENKLFLESLSRTEFRLMSHLIRSLGRLCKRDEIISFVSGSSSIDYGLQRSLGVYIQSLRRKIIQYDAKITIETSRGMGYTLVKIKE